MEFISRSPRKTQGLGRDIGFMAQAGDVVCLFGELGTGKTVLTKGIAQGLDIPPDSVRSPSFVLLNIYQGRLALYHFDFFRLGSALEIEDIGWRDYLDKGVVVMEWPDRLQGLLPFEYLRVEITYTGRTTRRLCLKGEGGRYQRWLRKIRLLQSRGL